MEPEGASTVARIKTAAVNGDSSAQARFLLWGIGLEMLRAHPLLGVGGGDYSGELFADGRAQFAKRNPQSDTREFQRATHTNLRTQRVRANPGRAWCNWISSFWSLLS